MASHSAGLLFLSSNLPDHCSPSTPFLLWLSSVLHTCVPTPLAFISTLFGCISILAWLFAQLPQIIKNACLKSTSGLSVYFLVEWCLGDISNVIGAILTRQASWQIVIGGYYCFVDFVLVGQWIWFEGLGRGRKIRKIWRRVSRDQGDDNDGSARGAGEHEDLNGFDSSHGSKTHEPHPPLDIPRKDSMFRTPDYGSFRSTKEGLSSSSRKEYFTIGGSLGNSFPSPSPRTILLASLVLCMASTTVSASPVPSQDAEDFSDALLPLGTLLSWFSTALYLCSRLPQLLRNFRLRSTAGLSPLLFAAAFFGNLFYSSSLLLNPNLWNNYPAYGGGGWVGVEGNDRYDWMLSALPFWLGAAGVLIMDASIGVQFWLWGGKSEKHALHAGQEEVLVVEADGKGKKSWEEVHGWMRGWMPDVSRSFSRIASPRPGSAQEPLLGRSPA